MPRSHGQWRTHARADITRLGSNQRYGYDNIGRLTRVADTTGTICALRTYGFGVNTNRTSKTESFDSTCPTTPGTPTTSTYDTADRIADAGYDYDELGRAAKVALPGGGSDLEYHVNDMARRQTTVTGAGSASRQTWTLDPEMRLRGWTTETRPNTTGSWSTTATKTNHYSGDAGEAASPAWISETATTIKRNVIGLTGELNATTDATGVGEYWLFLTTLHGDLGQGLRYTAAGGNVPTSHLTYDTDEYGNQKSGTSAPAHYRYNWLGAHQRSIETVNRTLVLMGVRLYNPSTGQFTSPDPVMGGNENAYNYPADPVGSVDLDGKVSRRQPYLDNVTCGNAGCLHLRLLSPSGSYHYWRIKVTVYNMKWSVHSGNFYIFYNNERPYWKSYTNKHRINAIQFIYTLMLATGRWQRFKVHVNAYVYGWDPRNYAVGGIGVNSNWFEN